MFFLLCHSGVSVYPVPTGVSPVGLDWVLFKILIWFIYFRLLFAVSGNFKAGIFRIVL